MKELKGTIHDLIYEYFERKIADIEIDEDTKYEIWKAVTRLTNTIEEKLEDTNEEIDEMIEQLSEPSDYEYDLQADIQERFRDLRGA